MTKLASPVDARPAGAAPGAAERDAGVEFPRQRLIGGAALVAFFDVAAVVVERHRIGPRGKVEHRLAELAGVARAVGVERPARLPGDDVVRRAPARRVSRLRPRRPFRLSRRDASVTPADLSLADASANACLRRRRRHRPAVGLKNRQPARLRRRGAGRRAVEAWKAWVSAHTAARFRRRQPKPPAGWRQAARACSGRGRHGCRRG